MARAAFHRYGRAFKFPTPGKNAATVFQSLEKPSVPVSNVWKKE
jgi:hypothetical protein